MKPRDFIIAVPLLAACVVFYFIGFRNGWKTQKQEDTEHNIRRSLRFLHYAEAGAMTNIVKLSRGYLYAHTRVYDELVPEGNVPEKLKPALTEARKIAREVHTNLVTFDPRAVLEK